MNTISFIQEDLNWAHQLLQMVTADLTPEQAHWQPPGLANPIGALFAHAVVGEDAIVLGLLKGDAPLFATEWAGRTGVSDPQMQMTLDWAQSLQVDLPTLREYASAVQATAASYVSGLDEEVLGRELDLTAQGLGVRTFGWALSALVIGHINNMSGEISALKGVQGAQGYPF